MRRFWILAAVLLVLSLVGPVSAFGETYAGRTSVTNFSTTHTATITHNPGCKVESIVLHFGAPKSYTATVTAYLEGKTIAEKTDVVVATQTWKYVPPSLWAKNGDRIIVAITIADTGSLFITYLR